MEVQRRKPTAKGPAEWFSGDVWIDPIARGQEPSHLTVSAVHFTPGARTAWHSHSNGQTLYVTEREGLVQTRGEPIVSIRHGDTVHTPADEWHWHGATPDNFMTHLSITDGDAAWGEHVTEDEYHGDAAS
jgi:quercetin dioxygenase-like cupin family protein